MRTFLTGIFLILTSLTAIAQSDAAAIKILDRFSALALGAPSISMKFTMETIDQAEGTTNNSSGSIILSRDRYRIDLSDNIIWFNGETLWSYLPVEKEVTISKPERKENSFLSKPSAVFSVYKKGYKVRLLEETSGSYLIDLYPEDINSDHVRIRLNISKPALDLKSLEYKYKNGITAILTVREYDLKQQPDNSEFTFSPDKYKGVEIIDMR
jgi:outer membrane lipoprotein-sorting protein